MSIVLSKKFPPVYTANIIVLIIIYLLTYHTGLVILYITTEGGCSRPVTGKLRHKTPGERIDPVRPCDVTRTEL
jgi:hypothetical protein